MSEEKRKILEMLESGLITQEDAQRLLDALGETADEKPTPPKESVEGELPTSKSGSEKTLGSTIKQNIGKKWQMFFDKQKRSQPISLTLHPDELETLDHLEIPRIPEIPDVPELKDLPEIPEPASEEEWQVASLVELTPQELHSVHIHWASGNVTVRPHDDPMIRVQETAARPLDENQKMACRLEEGELVIRYTSRKERSDQQTLGGKTIRKKLRVWIPTALMDQLEDVRVNCGSAGADVQGVQAKQVTVTCGSGSIEAAQLHCGEELSLKTGSGKIRFYESEILGETTVQAGSGSVHAERLQCGEELSVRTGSGGVQMQDIHVAGEATVQAGSGGVRAEHLHCEEDLSIRTASGGIQGDALTVAGEGSFHSASGGVTLNSGSIGEDLTVQVASGEVVIRDYQVGADAALSTASGELTVRDLSCCGDLQLNGTSGGIQANGLVVPGSAHIGSVSSSLQASFSQMPGELEVSTLSGHADVILPDSESGFTLSYRGGKTVPESDFSWTGTHSVGQGELTYGAGKTDFHFHTQSGSLQIHRG